MTSRPRGATGDRTEGSRPGTTAPHDESPGRDASGAEMIASDASVSSDQGELGAIRALMKRGSIYTFSTASQLLLSGLLLPILTRLMPAREYGVVALAILVGGLTGAIGNAGLPVALARTYFAEHDGPASARRLVLGAVVPSLVVVVIAEISSPLWMSLLGGVQPELAVQLGVLATVPSAVVAAGCSYLRCVDRSAGFVAITIVSNIGGTLIGIAAVAVDRGQGATAYMAGIVIGMGLGALLSLVLVVQHGDALPRWRDLQPALRVGTPLIPQGIAWLVLALGDRAVIQAMRGSGPVGRYQVAYTLGAVGLSLVTALCTALPPIIYGRSEAKQWDNLRVALATTTLLAAPVAAALALGGPLVLRLFVPASYRPAELTGVIAPVAASMLPWAIYGIRSGVLVWHTRTGLIAWGTIASAVANIVLVWLLLPRFGLAGAAIATLLAYWLLAWFMWYPTHREAPADWNTTGISAWVLASVLIVAGGVAPITGAWLALRLAATVTIGGAGIVVSRRLLSGNLGATRFSRLGRAKQPTRV
jgi:O-antigen/teichoic acid export membrane protein